MTSQPSWRWIPISVFLHFKDPICITSIYKSYRPPVCFEQLPFPHRKIISAILIFFIGIMKSTTAPQSNFSIRTTQIAAELPEPPLPGPPKPQEVIGGSFIDREDGSMEIKGALPIRQEYVRRLIVLTETDISQ